MASALRRLGAARASLAFRTPPPPLSFPPKQPTRLGSYKKSPVVKNLTGFTDFETIHRPEEWSHVESLLFRRTVPPLIPKEKYPSGWSPPKSSRTSNLPYFVERSCNHMIPVYLNIDFIGMRKITKVKHVMGDIQLLETEIREHLETKNRRIVATCINECGGSIRIKGDFLLDVKNFLEKKGF
ncbi:mitochondrial ribosomal protein L49 [Arctopsyche grandis]|uniref:mitochondrial ribosomal protein L49 n=1 Tax=Arctopsyche grandis TaxID=121162 RepID=UPI00406D6743